MKQFNVDKAVELTGEERETIETLVNYPSLERAFEQDAQTPNAEKIKRKMRATIVELERVVRRGAQAEAEKAARILTAYQTTLSFLEELERMKKSQTE